MPDVDPSGNVIPDPAPDAGNDPTPDPTPAPDPTPDPEPAPTPDPTPDPVPPPDPAPPPHQSTFGDLLAKLELDEETVQGDEDEITAAQQALAAVNDRLRTATEKRAADLAVVDRDDSDIAQALSNGGPRFRGPNPDGSIDVYTADGNGSYHVTNVKPADAPL